MHSRIISAAVVVTALGLGLYSQQVEACGCFAPPDPSVPIVQAGERILFAVDNGVVTAHIQIQYAGEAKDFGWLLPLPSVPVLKLGTEELFTQLINTTQPRYFVKTVVNGTCAGGNPLGGVFTPQSASADGRSSTSEGAESPLVTQASIGPYDYAVLKADSKEAMLGWLAANHYFIPAGTEATVGPYINPGSYFLALKLKSGQSAGDIQPVVLTYNSELPMIPIILTSVAAQPNMGIQVWMLGSSRAIPRNYNHVVINDAQLDWLAKAVNYNDVVIKAISETPQKHAFITEYAGPSSVMAGVLDRPGRFGSIDELKALTDPAAFVQYLFTHGYAQNTPFGPISRSVLTPLVKSLVLGMLPRPTRLLASVTDDVWLQNLGLYLGSYRAAHPDEFAGWEPAFDASALSAQLDEKIVRPAREAGALFNKYPKLTRLYTALSPEDMTRDPVFSFNPALPEVSRDHTATLTISCNIFTSYANAPRTLTTEQGWSRPINATPLNPNKSPSSFRIETLSEEGPPKVLTDNTSLIDDKPPGCGCSSLDPASLGLLALLATMMRKRRRTNAS